ncbi:hypothetical protein SLA2020_461570 [Shorea laevis]
MQKYGDRKHDDAGVTTIVKQGGESQRLVDKTVKDLMGKQRLVEVPYMATLGDTMNTLVANEVVAVPVAAPPGHWIGAGGSMIMEADKQTGVVRKHYIGMVTMLDIVAHIAGDHEDETGRGVHGVSDLDKKMTVPVSSIIGHCLEGLSLWTLNPTTSILDCMELFSKGIHRALVPLDGQMENVVGVELVESASSYRMLTQMDLLRFLRKYHSSELQGILSRSIKELGAVNENVYAITDRTTVKDAIKCLKTALLNAVPIVEASGSPQEDLTEVTYGKGRKPIGTFSSTDLRGCHFSTLQTWLPLNALQFTEQVSRSPLYGDSNEGSPRRELVMCQPESPLSEAIEKAVSKHVHRVWVVDQQGLLVGLISLTDMIKVIRSCLLSRAV